MKREPNNHPWPCHGCGTIQESRRGMGFKMLREAR